MANDEAAKQNARDFANRIQAAADHAPHDGTDLAAIRHMLAEFCRGAAALLRAIADE